MGEGFDLPTGDLCTIPVVIPEAAARRLSGIHQTQIFWAHSAPSVFHGSRLSLRSAGMTVIVQRSPLGRGGEATLACIKTVGKCSRVRDEEADGSDPAALGRLRSEEEGRALVRETGNLISGARAYCGAKLACLARAEWSGNCRSEARGRRSRAIASSIARVRSVIALAKGA